MPRAKPKPGPGTQQHASEVNGPAPEVLTLPEVAAYLRLSELDVLRLVADQNLPARRLANEWRFLKSAVQHWLSTPPTCGKEAQRAVLGAWKDDPDIEQIVEEAMRARGRPQLEDGTYSGYKRR